MVMMGGDTGQDLSYGTGYGNQGLPVPKKPVQPLGALPLTPSPGVSVQPPVPMGGGSSGPPPSIMPPAPSAPGTQAFGPGSNLIGTQVGPGSPSGSGGLMGQAGQNVGQATLGPLAGPGSDTGQARQQLSGLLGGIGASAPNRMGIAQDALKTFDENQANTEKLGVQNIGRENAAAGRLGSGMVNTSLGDLQANLNQSRNQELRGLAGDVAGQTLQDRLNAIQGTSGALGQMGGMDLAQQRFGLDAGNSAADLALRRGAAQQSLEGQQFGEALSGRNEVRGERDYQNQLAQQAIQNHMQQFGLEQGAQAQAFGQQYDTNQQLQNLGFGGDTAGTLGGLANQYAGNAQDSFGGTGALLQSLLQNQGGGQPSGGMDLSSLLASLGG